MTPAEILAYALVGMLAAILLACALVGAVCAVVRQVLARVRAGHEDRPSDAPDALHRCPVCYDLAADEANGIVHTDFELWESEWTP